MKEFFDRIRRQLLPGSELSRLEQDTIEAVIKRMRVAIRAGRGIRLSKKELQTLGQYGLKTQDGDVPPEENQLPFDKRNR